MPKKYRVTDPTSNKSLVVSMDHEPTDDEVEQIFKTQNAPPLPKVQLPAALDSSKPAPAPSGLAGVKSFLFPSTQDVRDRVARDQASSKNAEDQSHNDPSFGVRSIDELHKSAHEIYNEPAAVLDIPHHLANIARDAGRTLDKNKGAISDAVTKNATLPNIATVAATASPKLALPINLGYLGKSAADMYQDPSVANISEISKALGNILMGGVGISDEAPPTKTSKSVQPKVSPPNTGVTHDPDIDVSFTTSGKELPSGKTPAQIPEKASPNASGPITPRLVTRTESGNPIRGQGFTMGAPKVIRPTNEGVYEVPAPATSKSASTRLDYGGGEGSRLVEKSTGFKTVPKVNAPKSAGQELTNPTKPSEIPDTTSKVEQSGKSGNNRFDQSSMGEFSTTIKNKGISEQDFHNLVEWGIKPGTLEKLTPEEIKTIKSKVTSTNRSTSAQTLGKMKEEGETFYQPNKNYSPAKRAEAAGDAFWQPEEPALKAIQHKAPIENKWLRQADNDLLQTMRPGSSGQLAQEIDTVLGERGLEYKEHSQATPEPQLNEEAFKQYQEVLNSLASHGSKIGHIVLRDAAELGKKAGLDRETITNDLIDNLHPEVSNPVNKSHNAARKVFEPPTED